MKVYEVIKGCTSLEGLRQAERPVGRVVVPVHVGPKTLASILDQAGLTVDKVRQQWIAGPIVIAIDTVTRLGSFVEFEYRGDADHVETANAELDRFIASLGVDLGERDWRGYPYHLLERQS